MREGYQVCGRKFGPTITIWATKEQAEQYMKEFQKSMPEETWRIITVNVMEVSDS